MDVFPKLESKRLVINEPTVEDKPSIVSHLNQSSVFSDNTLNIPYPYTMEDADFFIEQMVKRGFEMKSNYTFAIRLKESPELIGAIGIHHDRNNHRAELGYWIATEHWGKGYGTEALQEILHFGFEELKLNKIFATHYPHNPASGKIMMKCGMKKEAELKKEYCKNGQFLDVIRYSIFRD